MDKDLIKLLENSGFTGKEALVYLALLELGSGTVAQIAKKTDLKRPIIYVIIEGLMKRGYVNELPDRKVNAYQPVDPTIILRQLKDSAQNFAEMLPLLKTLSSKGIARPKLIYIDSKDGIWKIYQQMSSAKEAMFITSYEKIENHFPGSVEKWTSYLGKHSKLRHRHLVPENSQELELAKIFLAANQEIRSSQDILESVMDLAIYDGKLAITSLGEEPFAVVIESLEIADSMRPLFENLWSRGKGIV